MRCIPTFYHFKVTWFLCQAGVKIRNKYLVVAYTYYACNFSASIQGPSGVMVSSVNRTEITIRWTEVNSICSGSISYSVTSSNCSSVTCNNIARTEATCSNLPIPSMCAFSIRSEACEQSKTLYNVITVTLRRMLL